MRSNIGCRPLRFTSKSPFARYLCVSSCCTLGEEIGCWNTQLYTLLLTAGIGAVMADNERGVESEIALMCHSASVNVKKIASLRRRTKDSDLTSIMLV